jgi:hypothetical protein
LGELERYVEYAARESADGILIALDCEDFCPVETASNFCKRISALNLEKRVGICFFYREFEAMFFYSLDEIIQKFSEFEWKFESTDVPADPEKLRNAKGALSKLMRKDRAYKESRDQAKFTTVMDLDKVRLKSRSFRHLEKTVLWLASDTIEENGVYPFIAL